MENIKKIAKEIYALEGYNYNPLTVLTDEVLRDITRGFDRVIKGLEAIDDIKKILDRDPDIKAELDADFKRLRKDEFEEQIRKVKEISKEYDIDTKNLGNMVQQLRDSIYTIAGK